MTRLAIVLDTTETCKDFLLVRPDFVILQEYLPRHSATLVVPEVVVQETTNHFQERLQQEIEAASKIEANISRLLVSLPLPNLPRIDLEEEVQSYKEKLQSRLAELDAKQPGYDSVAIQNLFERALKRRKPFDGKGQNGFRDALLWETILHEVAPSFDQVVFVTRNKADFGEHGALAPELQNDLSNAGLRAERVAICGGLARFVAENVQPSLTTLGEILKELTSTGGYKQFHKDEFLGLHEEEITNRVIDEWSAFEARTQPCVEAAIFAGCDPTDVRRVNDKVAALEFDLSIDADCSTAGMAARDFEWWTAKWGEAEGGKVVFDVHLTVLLDVATGKLGSWQIDHFHARPVQATR